MPVEPVDAAGDPPKTLRPVPGGVHRRRDREQDLRGADVARGLLPADVLLAGLEGKAKGRSAGVVDRDAHHSARKRPCEGLAGGDEAGVRPAEAHRHAEALHGADRDVRAGGGRRAREHGCEGVADDHRQAAGRVNALDGRCQVAKLAGGAGEGEQGSETGRRQRPRRGRPTISTPIGSARVSTTAIVCGWQSSSTKKTGESLLRAAPGHRHGLGRGGALVEQRRVRERQSGEVGDQRLEVEQRLQAALRDLGLVGGVGRVPGGVLEHVAPDHRGRDRVVVAHADQRGHDPVLVGDLAGRRDGLGLGDRIGQRERRVQPDRGRHGVVDQGVEIRGPDRVQHDPLLVVARTDVARREARPVLEVVERRALVGRRRLLAHGRHSRVAGVGRTEPPLSWLPERCTRVPGFPRRRDACAHPLSSVAAPATVRVPERFRGGCSFGADSGSGSPTAGDRRVEATSRTRRDTRGGGCDRVSVGAR